MFYLQQMPKRNDAIINSRVLELEWGGSTESWLGHLVWFWLIYLDCLSPSFPIVTTVTTTTTTNEITTLCKTNQHTCSGSGCSTLHLALCHCALEGNAWWSKCLCLYNTAGRLKTFLVPGFSLVQPQCLQPFGESVNGSSFSFSVPLSLCHCVLNKVNKS